MTENPDWNLPSSVNDGRDNAGPIAGTPATPWVTSLPATVANGIGFTSGVYPARQAAQLDPIAALRTE